MSSETKRIVPVGRDETQLLLDEDIIDEAFRATFTKVSDQTTEDVEDDETTV